jgi:hypothetical protein
VTLGDGTALTSNYLRVEMAAARPANQLISVSISGVGSLGVCEAAPVTR